MLSISMFRLELESRTIGPFRLKLRITDVVERSLHLGSLLDLLVRQRLVEL